MEDFHKVAQNMRNNVEQECAMVILKLIEPPSRVIKIKWYATIDISTEKMIVGKIVRDHEGKVLVPMLSSKPYIYHDPTVA